MDNSLEGFGGRASMSRFSTASARDVHRAGMMTSASAYRTSFVARSGSIRGMGTSPDEVMDSSINFGDEISFGDGVSQPPLAGGGTSAGNSNHRSMVDIFLAEDNDDGAGAAVVSMRETERAARAKRWAMYMCLAVVFVIIFVTAPKPGFMFGGGNQSSSDESSSNVEAAPMPNGTSVEPSGGSNEGPQSAQGESESVTKPPLDENQEENQVEISAEIQVDMNRPQAIQAFILEKQVTVESELRDEKKPAFEALEWIATEDKAMVDIPGYSHNSHNDPDVSQGEMGVQLLQRYSLGVFYFSMENTYFQGGEQRKRERHERRERRRALLLQQRAQQRAQQQKQRHDNPQRQLHDDTNPSAEEFDRQIQFEDHWITQAHVCDWFGITCNDQKLVTDINLTSSILEGRLVAELFQETALPALTSLDLSHNALHGEFPEHPIVNNKLEFLNLEHNQLEQHVDPILGQLRALKTLDLSTNAFTGELPNDWSVFSQDMVTLKLASNKIQGTLPPHLGLLDNIEWLQLDGNALTGGFPDQWKTLTNLRTLKIAHNMLQGTLPSFLGELPLNHVSLQDNQLTGKVPSEFGKLTELQDMHLQMTKLEGTMPTEVCDLFGNGGGQGALTQLTADCKAPRVKCTCCTACY